MMCQGLQGNACQEPKGQQHTWGAKYLKGKTFLHWYFRLRRPIATCRWLSVFLVTDVIILLFLGCESPLISAENQEFREIKHKAVVFWMLPSEILSQHWTEDLIVFVFKLNRSRYFKKHNHFYDFSKHLDKNSGNFSKKYECISNFLDVDFLNSLSKCAFAFCLFHFSFLTNMTISMWVSPVIPQGLISISISFFNKKFKQVPLSVPDWVFKYKQNSGTSWAAKEAQAGYPGPLWKNQEQDFVLISLLSRNCRPMLDSHPFGVTWLHICII